MTELVRYIQFPLLFDKKLLKNDVSKVLSDNWVKHYNTNDYSGDWDSIALMSQGGKSGNIYALPSNNDEVIFTEALDSCSYFKEVINQFKFQKTSVRLLRLSVGAEIKPHKDYCLGYEDGCFRIHIPIITNPEVEFILDNTRLIMNEGECWYINANFTHSVANRGKEDRIHLVIDGIRNEWTDNLFFKNARKDGFEKKIVQNTKEEKEKIIQELRKMNTPVADKLISDLLNEID
ncbi:MULTISPECIES: aspartyl/asparaginyl beta-hydroxylase domain-containing protein [Flavobacterium]|uniref:Aspartyl/asparaginy/proline hydroxylase domain-containing protein n=1 Tax=Flavobacterium hankyongi TaxID=1176532 RepID=A0ABP8ZIT1_9FLAO|nr:aspartyl/asparaginyl beta-hydroxylase domain-containing protein [Flavobacterium sp. N1846]